MILDVWQDLRYGARKIVPQLSMYGIASLFRA